MKNAIYIGAGTFLIIILLALGGYTMSVFNRADTLLELYNGKVKTNQSDFDNMSKVISQTAQVSKAQMERLKEIYNSYAEARTGKGASDAIMKWVQESVPNVDTSVMSNLQNIIVANRNGWTERQRELVGITVEFNTLLSVRPSKWFLNGYDKLDPLVITSEDTEQTFRSKQENNTKLDL